MNYSLEVCLVTLTLAISITPSAAAQSKPTPTENPGAPTMQAGISVQLPVTSNAVPVPKADKEDAPIVTVTRDGSVYFGISPVSPTTLAERVKLALSNQPEKKLYIKADARTPYANLVKVLDVVHAAGVKGLTLLTAQQDSAEPGTPVSPKGFELLVASSCPAAGDRELGRTESQSPCRQ